MTPGEVRIRCGARTARFLVLSRDISIGPGPENEFIVCHPALPRDGIRLGGTETDMSGRSLSEAPHRKGKGPPLPADLGDLSIEIRALPWRAFALALLAAALVLPLVFLAAGGDTSQDWTPIPLPAEGPFGLCRQDGSHPQGARFCLPEDAAGGDVLEFVPGGGGKAQTVRLTLNGRAVGGGIALSSGWGEAIQVALPEDTVAAERNLIEFRPLPESTPAEPWGIRDLRILPRARNAGPDPAAREAAEATLADPLCGGPELAGCYLRLTQVVAPGHSAEREREDALIDRLEDRMGQVLRGDLRRARALALSGKTAEAHRLRDAMSSWVPPRWIEGRELLGGFAF